MVREEGRSVVREGVRGGVVRGGGKGKSVW